MKGKNFTHIKVSKETKDWVNKSKSLLCVKQPEFLEMIKNNEQINRMILERHRIQEEQLKREIERKAFKNVKR